MCLLLVILLMIGFSAFSQNLVPNPSFEYFSVCPETFTIKSSFFNKTVDNWFSPTLGTPDYFNKCSSGNVGVPFNWVGGKRPHSGNAYIGMFLWNTNDFEYREYAQTMLLDTLIKDVQYEISLFYTVANNSSYAVSSIGIYISNMPFNEYTIKSLSYKPHIQEDALNFQPQTHLEWKKLSGIYTAHGSERFICIGNFSRNSATGTYLLTEEIETRNLLYGKSYYLIDDVSVVPIIPADFDTINVNKLKQGQRVVLNNIYFEYNKFDLLPESFAELDRLYEVLQIYRNYSIEISGHTDITGEIEYNIKLSENRAKAVVDYLNKRGIDKARLRYKGYGSILPIASNKYEAGRMKNRRVEFRLVSTDGNSTFK